MPGLSVIYSFSPPPNDPRENELEELESETREGNDVWVCKTSPRDNLAVEGPWSRQ